MNERQKTEIRKSNFGRLTSSVLLALSCFSALPADATLLHGYVSDAAPQQEHLLGAAKTEAKSPARRDSFAQELQGAWQCVTVVIDSLVDTVPVGQKVISRMDFVKTTDGRVVARFLQPGWTEAQETITAYSSSNYQMDKTNYYYGDQMGGSWAARSRDRYQVLEANRMIAESEVDQYMDGRYVGRYRTRSTLVRVSNGMENVALTPMPDPDDQSGDKKLGF
ncbi:MAG: hypothetical protein K2X27_18170 [Candidatus Obscuribacterales bacterium]|nr:hypothetical protein [Candidatus Obscuribacterales bacterium]